jgi:hypothetical protein
MACYYNDFGHAQEQYVIGWRSKAPSVKSVELFHELPVELQDSLLVTSKKYVPESHQKILESRVCNVSSNLKKTAARD